MDPFHFACPHCSSPLRVRDKLYVGRHFDCPECGQPLRIAEANGKMGVERAERPAGAPPAKVNPAQPATDAKGGASQPAPKPSSTAAGGAVGIPSAAAPVPPPRAIAKQKRSLLILAAAIVLGGVICALAVHFRSTGGSPAGSATRRDPAAVAADNQDPVQPASPQDDQPPRSETEQRLSRIGEGLLDILEIEGSFPSGTVPILGMPFENRLSWMAVLAERTDTGSAPDPAWDRPWNAPQNDPFVRRRLTMFQNPAIGELTGADGYPASHFVGVTGVGPNAARLDPRSARAGIFGNDRHTRLADIPDGASNTLLVLGVRDQLGSWAAGGTATMRGLTGEPYVNGPDGFGTGSADSMHALLADGRVISISDKIDPRIMRRMAAKADGLSLDESEDGEPGDRPSLLAGALADDDDDPEQPVAGVANRDRPIEPEFAPEPAAPAVRKIDLAMTLKQPIARFEQPRSRPLDEILISVAEMAGARIVYDPNDLGPAAARLEEPAALKLENTTVGDILTGLLTPVGLAYRVEGDHLRVILRPAE